MFAFGWPCYLKPSQSLLYLGSNYHNTINWIDLACTIIRKKYIVQQHKVPSKKAYTYKLNPKI